MLYNSTAAGGPLIGWWDYGSSIAPADTETFAVKPNGASTGGSICTLQ